jgi:hypothetical protein
MWGTFLACALLIIVPAFAVQPEPAQCYITGKVYGAEELGEVDARLTIPEHCPISWTRYERRLVLTSHRWRVEIALPRGGGWMDFRYMWGHAEAYIGTEPVQIVAGPAQMLGAR